MSTPAIRVRGLSKQYRIGERVRYKSLRESLTNAVTRTLKGTRRREETIWALKDVSFEVAPGEVVGVIGRNGAGKSTLLKILSRITEPTEGRVELHGRVGSLLEVGTGFHQELTGRENIFLNGAILGMKRVEIARKFDEIVAFAEIEKFLDTPVKHYSTGMYLRLAFAVAAHLEPEILLVDEVLAVGDAEFQKKCLGKMGDVARGGRTVLFVSHNMASVRQLTNRCLVLGQGSLAFVGSTDQAVDFYSNEGHLENQVDYDVEQQPRAFKGRGDARFTRLAFLRRNPIFAFAEPLEFTATIRRHSTFAQFRISMTVFRQDGTPVGSSFGHEISWPHASERVDVRVSLRDARLSAGRYYCGVSVGRGNYKSVNVDFDVVLDTLHFEVLPEQGAPGTTTAWPRNWGSLLFSPLQCHATSEPVEEAGR